MRALYEVHSYEGHGFIQFPVTVAYFESPELAQQWCDMWRERDGANYEVQEIQRMDRVARRAIAEWKKTREDQP